MSLSLEKRNSFDGVSVVCVCVLARASRRCFASRPLLWATPLGITVQRKPDQRGQLMVHSWAEAVNFTPSGARKTSLRLPSNTPESSTRSSAVIDFLSTGPRLRFGPASHAIKGMSLQQPFHHLCYCSVDTPHSRTTFGADDHGVARAWRS